MRLLSDEAELGLMKVLADWPRAVEAAALAHEPHRIAFYLYDLAASFHSYWNKGKEDPTLRFIRWRNAAQWARNTMVNEDGRMKKTKNGVWEISGEGRKWLKTSKEK